IYDAVNEAWEVRWFFNGKFHGKPFPIKKFGIIQAKTEALNFAHTVTGATRQEYHSEISGVFWDERTQAWFAKYTCDFTGGMRSRGYSADKWGFEEARRKAEQKVKMSSDWLALQPIKT
ncbi:hypothetical protein C9890_0029, partial [Perkinsus sp. BL_2016]